MATVTKEYDHGKYIGQFINGMRNGYGVMKYKSGSTYSGEWRNDTIDGKGVYIWNGGDEYNGQWKNNKRNGSGVHIWADNTCLSYDGEWKDNEKHGYGVMKYKSGNTYSGDWRNDKRHGKGVAVKNGDTYSGDWINGQMNGKGVFTWNNGQKYEGQWKNGKYNGIGVFTYKKDDKRLSYDGEWKDNKKHGYGVMKYKDGSSYSGMWKKGKKDFNIQEVTLDDFNDSKDDVGDDEEFVEMRNPYVVIIGISKYTNYSQLPGVKLDVAKMKKLWCNVANYRHVNIITEDDKHAQYFDKKDKEVVSLYELKSWINQRVDWLEKNGKKYGIDGLVVVYSGHGTNKEALQNNFIVTSDGKDWALANIQATFGECVFLHKKPKIFFIDMCRGKNAVQTVAVVKNIGVKGTKSNIQITHINPLEDCYTHYSTSDNFQAYDDAEKGGYLINAVHDEYLKQFKKGKAVDMDKIGTKLNRHIQNKRKNNQVPVSSNGLTVTTLMYPSGKK